MKHKLRDKTLHRKNFKKALRLLCRKYEMSCKKHQDDLHDVKHIIKKLPILGIPVHISFSYSWPRQR